MNKRLKSRWIEALRSGKYKQGKGALQEIEGGSQVDKFCCLGVLCQISPKTKALTLSVGDKAAPKRLSNQAYLSEPASAYAGLNAEAQGTLSKMNDSGGYSFNKIAKWIEKNL